MASGRNQKQVHEICKIMGRRSDVKDVLVTRIAQGKELLGTSVQSDAQLEELSVQHMQWNDYNRTFLKNSFTTDEARKAYDAFPSFANIYYGEEPPKPLHERIAAVMTSVRDQVLRLTSLLNKLNVIPEENPSSQTQEQGTVQTKSSNSVFVVHGHNETMLTQVEAFLRKLKLRPVILKDEPSKGQTIIEKLELNADVGYAIVLLTADDEGKEKGAPSLGLRARQNAILELGYFMGRLGRQKVCAIREKSVELPSDYSGVVYIESENWQLPLSKELRSAGLKFDLNDVLS